MENVNGILIVDKPVGFTSHDVVNVIRKIYSMKKVGHTGTLDPDATGVLPICLGKATKVCDMLTFSDKQYIARVRLGIETDTQDISGNVICEKEVNVTKDELLDVIKAHTGEIMQIPPMYSAIKINGQKLCDLARKGVEVERKPRKITVYSAEMSDFDGVEFNLKVDCSKGTYIRTLCHDIGKMLGCGAVITSLRRTKASVFSLENAHTLDELKTLASENKHTDALISIDSVFSGFESMTVDANVMKKVCNGAVAFVNAECKIYRLYDKQGNFLGIADVKENADGGKNMLKMTKAFF